MPAGERHPDYQPGNRYGELSVRHGAYSPRKVGELAQVVRDELVAMVPSLGSDVESASLLAAYCRATAREELGHLAIEAGNLSPRLLEAVSASSRVAKELGDSLGLGPLASAQLREVRSKAALNVAELLRQAPSIMAAIAKALRATGLEEHSERFTAALDAALVEVMQQDD